MRMLAHKKQISLLVEKLEVDGRGSFFQFSSRCFLFAGQVV